MFYQSAFTIKPNRSGIATFEIPKNNEKEFPVLDIYPLTIRVTERGLAKPGGYDGVMDKATHRFKRAINRLWARYHHGQFYYLDDFDSEDEEEDMEDLVKNALRIVDTLSSKKGKSN